MPIFNKQATKSKSRGKTTPSFHVLKNHPFVIPVTTFLVLFFFSLAVFISLGGQTIGATDTLVVRLSIDGKQQVVPTRAQTVADLVKRLNLELNPADIIEPSLETEILDDNFSVNIYKARPITIIDEGRRVTKFTAAPTPQAVAKEAGIEVFPEDKFEKQTTAIEPEDVIRDGLVTETLVIDRATAATINLYGTTIPIRTHVETVAEALNEKNIQTLPDDVITPSLDTPLVKGTNIFIVRLGKQIDSREEIIPMPVEVINDPNALAGSQVIREQGNPGRKVVTYEVELQNGKEVSRKVLQEVIATQPVKQVVVKGTKVVYSNPSANVEMGRQIAADMGWSHEFSCIYSIFERESRWNHLARNRSSGAYGIPQALPGNKMGPGWESDPAVQIRWGIGYMVNRYGSPCKAQAFWNVNHWY